MRLYFLLIIFILVGNVSAYTFVDIYLDESGSTLFLGGTDEIISFPEGVEVKNGEVIGKTQTLTSKTGEIWSFYYYLDGAEINLIFPEGAMIKSIKNGEIFVKDNKIYVYSVGKIDLTYVIGEQSNNLSLWIFIGIFIFIFFGFLFYKKKELKSVSKKKQELIKEILGERENLILNKLRETGKIKGSELRKICDIPKASFSRHIQELERKGLLKKTGEGKSKFFELS